MRFSLLAGFLAKTILWLLACLAIWLALGQFMAMPVAWLTGALAHTVLPGWVEGVEQAGTQLSLLTSLEMPPQPGTPAGQVGVLVAEADYLTYGYSLPLLMALFLASWPPRMAGKMVLGALALLPFQSFSVIFAWLKQVAILAGPAIAAQTDFGDTGRNLIGLGYQFGSLVLPTLVPVVLWLILDRKLVSTLLVEAYLNRAEPDAWSNRDGSSRGE